MWVAVVILSEEVNWSVLLETDFYNDIVHRLGLECAFDSCSLWTNIHIIVYTL